MINGLKSATCKRILSDELYWHKKTVFCIFAFHSLRVNWPCATFRVVGRCCVRNGDLIRCVHIEKRMRILRQLTEIILFCSYGVGEYTTFIRITYTTTSTRLWTITNRFLCIKNIDNNVKFGYYADPLTANSFLCIYLLVLSGTQCIVKVIHDKVELSMWSHWLFFSCKNLRFKLQNFLKVSAKRTAWYFNQSTLCCMFPWRRIAVTSVMCD